MIHENSWVSIHQILKKTRSVRFHHFISAKFSVYNRILELKIFSLRVCVCCLVSEELTEGWEEGQLPLEAWCFVHYFAGHFWALTHHLPYHCCKWHSSFVAIVFLNEMTSLERLMYSDSLNKKSRNYLFWCQCNFNYIL